MQSLFDQPAQSGNATGCLKKSQLKVTIGSEYEDLIVREAVKVEM